MTGTTITVKLSRPYTLAGKEAETISFREPKLADLLDVERVAIATGTKGNHGMTVLMIAQLSGATQPEIAAFSLSDYVACDRAISPFMKTVGEAGGD